MRSCLRTHPPYHQVQDVSAILTPSNQSTQVEAPEAFRTHSFNTSLSAWLHHNPSQICCNARSPHDVGGHPMPGEIDHLPGF